MKLFRNNGAVGAYLDEYEKALEELQFILSSTTETELKTIVDKDAKDPDSYSIQTILAHVVSAGYYYATAIRNFEGENNAIRPKTILNSVDEYQNALKAMFQYNEQMFVDYPNLKIVEHDDAKKIHAKWGQHYDVDQLMEHAIMHVHRHRRQIERYLLRIRS